MRNQLSKILNNNNLFFDEDSFLIPAFLRNNKLLENYSWKHDRDFYSLELELPGVKKEDIDITIGDYDLIISWKDRFKKDNKISFDVIDVNKEKSEVKYENGLLILKINKKEEVKPKKIEIT
jgi:HSP20 family protein